MRQASPGSVTPAASVEAAKSAPPTTTGVPGASPVSRAAAAVTAPATARAGRSAGSRASLHARRRRALGRPGAGPRVVERRAERGRRGIGDARAGEPQHRIAVRLQEGGGPRPDLGRVAPEPDGLGTEIVRVQSIAPDGLRARAHRGGERRRFRLGADVQPEDGGRERAAVARPPRASVGACPVTPTASTRPPARGGEADGGCGAPRPTSDSASASAQPAAGTRCS